jgi:hypothetical protein
MKPLLDGLVADGFTAFAFVTDATAAVSDLDLRPLGGE